MCSNPNYRQVVTDRNNKRLSSFAPTRTECVFFVSFYLILLAPNPGDPAEKQEPSHLHRTDDRTTTTIRRRPPELENVHTFSLRFAVPVITKQLVGRSC